ncbi:hypothetical protein IGI04_019308 [Brassica rapa subsp. trilocularis]|uniref:Uncharacterized protein n=1 Tax=Brassica rapa subsp. trilocularis TaxID=1813537 RepID=A0ABQ7MFG1_BRACM|nr:hypothetical protein IGI04_019308 [Brassica rapa subsp. trilocularis]
MNQTQIVVATRSCSLLFDIYLFLEFCESSLNGCSHQVMGEKGKLDPYRLLPSRLEGGIRSNVYQAPIQAD